MINLNFSTAEELIFWDREAQQVLPVHFFSIFEQWRLSKRVSYLRDTGKHAILDFLNALSDDDVALLENYFDEKINLEKLSYQTVNNMNLPLNESICDKLCLIEGSNYFSLWRDENQLYLSIWK